MLGRRHRQQAAGLEVLPLYARLPSKEQNAVFAPHGRRRVVLATNVAESSLTVPGIRAVVDTGTARISRYAPRSKVQRLPIEAVSQASADQRCGRCGRLGPGICIRLYSEADYAAREKYTTPEIRRTIGVGHPPDPAPNSARSMVVSRSAPRDAIRDGYKTLFELGAIDRHRELTPLGQDLARLPVDPRVGRMILAADQQHCLAEVLIIAAALEVQDPRDRPPEKAEAADQCHARLADAQSDFFSFLKLWDFYHELKRPSAHQRAQGVPAEFSVVQRLRKGESTASCDAGEDSGPTWRAAGMDYDHGSQALLSGLPGGHRLFAATPTSTPGLETPGCTSGRDRPSSLSVPSGSPRRSWSRRAAATAASWRGSTRSGSNRWPPTSLTATTTSPTGTRGQGRPWSGNA